jgi:Transcription factor WhiB
MPTASASTATHAARCIELSAVFQDQLLEEPLPVNPSADMRRRQRALITRAQAACRECPLIIDCLYRAVVEHNVAGYVAGTTPAQRAQIRRSLGITVEPEDSDTLAGVTGPHRKVSHSEVIHLRKANPHESLEMLAQRFGCSLSTIKRHLRRERRRPSAPTAIAKPTMAEVLTATAIVTNAPLGHRRPQAAVLDWRSDRLFAGSDSFVAYGAPGPVMAVRT